MRRWGLTARLWAGVATVGAPVLRGMVRRRTVRGKEVAGRLGEREGIDASVRPEGTLVWLHAASVGESVSVLPVLEALGRVPDLWVLMTTGTVTSAEMLGERLPELGLERVLHRFVPLDVPRWAGRFLDHWRPDVAGFVESELWPNLLFACSERGVPVMLVNGRLSERSLRGWQRAPGFAREVVGVFARVHPQSEGDAARLVALGARGVEAPGNLKLAAPRLGVDEGELARLRGVIGGRPVWLASSTHEGEEAVAAAAHVRLAVRFPGLLTMVAPRHPGRGAALGEMLGGAPRRSRGEDPGAGGFWVADTLNELGLLFRLAPAVFVGGSLVPMGGHNPLEPARMGCAVAMGPHVGNMTEAVRRLDEAGALRTVRDAESLAAWVEEVLQAPDERRSGVAAASGEEGLPERVAQGLLELARAR